MAVTKSTTINSITVEYGHDDPVLIVHEVTTWDDPDDDQLPITRGDNRTINKTTHTTTYDEETGNPIHTETAYDYSGEDAKIVAICDVVWAE